MERRLSAIFAADMVGYSRLMEADEVGTLERQKAHRREFINPTFAKFHGRIVKEMGDGLLVEFPSVVEAVQCAVEIQQAMPEREAGIPENRRITYRVGINLGDVLIEGEDIHGDGVNVAARLEKLSEPGGVCISGTTYDHIHGQSHFSCQFLGEQQLKNISRPVRAYRICFDPDQNQPVARSPLSLPDKPSIAVLPFDNMSGDREQDYFADGIAEDIITALSRNSDLFVIARNSSFSYRGEAVDVRTIGEELGVRFVLEGSIRRAGDRVRVTAQLIEASSGNHIWAERYDRPVIDFFEVQDEITINVAGAVGSEIRSSEMRSSAGKSLENLQSWERLMKALWHIFRVSAEGNRIGQEICRREIEANNGVTGFHSALIASCFFELIYGWESRPPSEVIGEGMQAGRTAIELDPNDDVARANLGFLLWLTGQYDDALRELNAAVKLNPNNTWGYLALGFALAYSGPENYDRAMEVLRYSLRLGPRDVAIHWRYAHMAAAAFVTERYDDVIEYSRIAIQYDPKFGTGYRYLAATFALQGQTEAAEAAWKTSCEVHPIDLPSYSASVIRMFRRDADGERFLNALRKAGAPVE